MGASPALTSHALLQRLRADLAAGIVIPEEVSQWLLSGIDAHVQRGEPLERALGLARRGQRKANRTAANAQRDSWVCRAAIILGLKNDLSNIWEVARKLSAEIARYETRVWPRCKTSAAPDGSAVDIRVCIAMAFHYGGSVDAGNPVPSSARHIVRILKSNPLP